MGSGAHDDWQAGSSAQRARQLEQGGSFTAGAGQGQAGCVRNTKGLIQLHYLVDIPLAKAIMRFEGKLLVTSIGMCAIRAGKGSLPARRRRRTGLYPRLSDKDAGRHARRRPQFSDHE